MQEKLQKELDALKNQGPQSEGEEERKGLREKIRDFFRIQSIVDGFQAVLKKRDYYKRAIILLLIITFELEIFAMNGKWSSLYLYLRRKLNFDIVQYSYYTTTMGVIGIFAQYFAVPLLTRRFGFNDYTVAILGKYHYATHIRLHIWEGMKMW